jgi:hypothetical protein
MWLSEANPASPHPMPTFITPMWGPDGTLTHYVCMYGRWDETESVSGGRPRLTCMQARTHVDLVVWATAAQICLATAQLY